MLSSLVRHVVRAHGIDLDDRAAVATDETSAARATNAWFLAVLAGDADLEAEPQGEWGEFYRDGLKLIAAEVEQAVAHDPELGERFRAIERAVDAPADDEVIEELIWSALFPEGAGIRGNEDVKVAELRARRTVTIERPNPDPIERPAEQVLFTSNVLLTTPSATADLAGLPSDLRARLATVAASPQRYWYDHPVPIGAEAPSNEILQGLRHLDEAIALERHVVPSDRVSCVLSVSGTHDGLDTVGERYLRDLLAAEHFRHLDVYAFTESDVRSVIRSVLLPAVERHGPRHDAPELLSVLGVNGRYGRHYSFLKAIAALWNVLIDARIRATFKIDLDQTFPQSDLLRETGSTAFANLTTPLWGATGTDSRGAAVELGLIAGALVNREDIASGIHTPDVTFPSHRPDLDESVFFSRLPQALSTEAEIMTRYEPEGEPDGRTSCLERVHVTGGTTGILVDSLRRFRPFTPSFIGRAEDQAYVLTAIGGEVRLAYVHAPDLIMRHDKDFIAGASIASERVGKEIADIVRIVTFSGYVDVLLPSITRIKDVIDPYTGAFVSHLPITVALLRFSLATAGRFRDGETSRALDFVRTGVPRLREALAFTAGRPSRLQQRYEFEQQGWDLFFDSLSEIEGALREREDWALAVQDAARRIVAGCRIETRRGSTPTAGGTE